MTKSSSRTSANALEFGGECDGRARLVPSVGTVGWTIARVDREDAEALRRMLARCSAETVRLRFHRALATVSQEVVERLVGAWPKPWRGLALVALSEGEIVGHVMCVAEEPEVVEGEVAVVVEDAWQRRGIARALVARIVEEAAKLGIREFRGEILPENRAAFVLARRLPAGMVRCSVWGTRRATHGRRVEKDSTS